MAGQLTIDPPMSESEREQVVGDIERAVEKFLARACDAFFEQHDTVALELQAGKFVADFNGNPVSFGDFALETFERGHEGDSFDYLGGKCQGALGAQFAGVGGVEFRIAIDNNDPLGVRILYRRDDIIFGRAQSRLKELDDIALRDFHSGWSFFLLQHLG